MRARLAERREEFADLKENLSEIRDLMDHGFYLNALEGLEAFYYALALHEYSRDPELDKIRAAARKLAGKIRANMVLRPSLGQGKPPIAVIRKHLNRVRDLEREGQPELAMELLNTIWQALWYWEVSKDPGLQPLLEDARRLAALLRAEMPAQAMEGPWLGALGVENAGQLAETEAEAERLYQVGLDSVGKNLEAFVYSVGFLDAFLFLAEREGEADLAEKLSNWLKDLHDLRALRQRDGARADREAAPSRADSGGRARHEKTDRIQDSAEDHPRVISDPTNFFPNSG